MWASNSLPILWYQPFERTPFFYYSEHTRGGAYTFPHPLYLKFQIWHEFEICTRNTLVKCWPLVTTLTGSRDLCVICRPKIDFDDAIKNWNGFINQLLLPRDILWKVWGLFIFLSWWNKKLFENVKKRKIFKVTAFQAQMVLKL